MIKLLMTTLITGLVLHLSFRASAGVASATHSSSFAASYFHVSIRSAYSTSSVDGQTHHPDSLHARWIEDAAARRTDRRRTPTMKNEDEDEEDERR